MKTILLTIIAAVLLVGCGDAVSSKPITEPIVQARAADKIIPQVAQAVIADSSSSAKNSSLSSAEQASNKAANATNEEEQ